MKGLVYKLGSIVASLSLKVTALNVNTACVWIANQPKLPKGAEKLRRF